MSEQQSMPCKWSRAVLNEAVLPVQLRNQPFVDSEMMAAYGYCFGGGGAIQLMLSYPNNTEGLLGELTLERWSCTVSELS